MNCLHTTERWSAGIQVISIEDCPWCRIDALAAELAGAIQAGADVAQRCAKAWDQNVKLTERIFALEALVIEARWMLKKYDQDDTSAVLDGANEAWLSRTFEFEGRTTQRLSGSAPETKGEQT